MEKYKNNEVTEWFNGSNKPFRDGIYEINSYRGSVYRKYKHGWWYFAARSISSANYEYQILKPEMYLYFEWRGLASNPFESEK